MRFLFLYKIIILMIITFTARADDLLYFIDTDFILQNTKEYINTKNNLKIEFEEKYSNLEKQLRLANEKNFKQMDTNEILKQLKYQPIDQISNKTERQIQLEHQLIQLNSTYLIKEESLKTLIIKKIIKKTQDYAKKHGIKLILEKNSILIYNDLKYQNISNEVLKTIDF